MSRRRQQWQQKKKAKPLYAPRAKGQSMARGKLTKTQYLLLLERLGKQVCENVRQVVPERTLVVPSGGSDRVRVLPPQAVTRDELAIACAATAGTVVGMVLDILGVDVFEDPSADSPESESVQ